MKYTKYPHQKYFRDVDEALATHFPLVFLYFDLPIDSDLLKTFWETENEVRHKESILFIGHSVLMGRSGDKDGNINHHRGVPIMEDNKLISQLKVFRSKDVMQKEIKSLIDTLWTKDTK